MIVNTTRRAKTKILEDKPTEAELLASEETQATESDTAPDADTQSTDDLASEATEATEDADADASEETKAASQPQEMPLWCVEVKCPTPLAQNPKTIHAIDEETAWQVFCLQNGISGTDHPKTITRV